MKQENKMNGVGIILIAVIAMSLIHAHYTNQLIETAGLMLLGGIGTLVVITVIKVIYCILNK